MTAILHAAIIMHPVVRLSFSPWSYAFPPSASVGAAGKHHLSFFFFFSLPHCNISHCDTSELHHATLCTIAPGARLALICRRCVCGVVSFAPGVELFEFDYMISITDLRALLHDRIHRITGRWFALRACGLFALPRRAATLVSSPW